MKFIDFQPVLSIESGKDTYADVLNHCRDWTNFIERGDKPTSAHECTHGVNAALRNSHSMGRLDIFIEPSKILGITVGKPHPKLVQGFAGISGGFGGEINAFYVLKNRAVILPEPAFHKGDITQFIPNSFRLDRYATYVAGQHDWDGQPLYIFDEWTAYINGAMTATDLAKSGELKAGGTDWVMGPLEFVAYGLAVAMTADKQQKLVPDVADFTHFCLIRAFNAFLDGKASWPFPGQDELYERLKTGADGQAYRDFMKAKLAFVVPDAVQPEVTEDINKHLFKVV